MLPIGYGVFLALVEALNGTGHLGARPLVGMLGLEDDFSRVVPGGVGPETTQALRHVERILKACGASLSDIVKVSVYMTDLGQWDAMNEAYLAVLGEKTPARITVGCASLLFGASVELDCIAYR